MAEMTAFASPPATLLWRPMSSDDLDCVAALEAQIHAAPWTRVNFADALAAGYHALVGERVRRIVAYGVLMLAPGEAQILNLSVVSDQRRQGLGRTLLYRFLVVARERGAEQCFLEVRTTNDVALGLYTEAGFAAVGRRAGYYPATATTAREDALVLRCELAASHIR
jgi:ribosomal-protein-alanine acetyltransferase